MSSFSEDFGSVINGALEVSSAEDIAEHHTQPTVEEPVKDMQPDYKHRKALVTRIIKAVKSPFEDAIRKESELCQRPFEKELANLDKLLEESVLSRRSSLPSLHLRGGDRELIRASQTTRNGAVDSHYGNITDEDLSNEMDVDPIVVTQASADDQNHKHQRPTPDSIASTNGINDGSSKANRVIASSKKASKPFTSTEPPTPPMSSEGETQTLSCGGIPWYMEPFDPMGTTIYEERWTGRELVRGMSEDLSDMDEEELSGLNPLDEGASSSANCIAEEQAAKEKAKKRKAANARRRRW